MRPELPPHLHEAPKSPESRFGDRAAFERELNENPVVLVGPIQEALPDVKPSTNEVDLGVVVTESENLNSATLCHIEDERGGFFAVFKPFEGENDAVRESVEIGALYLRELLAAKVSEQLLKFDITPPIAIRSINGQLGSLQMYVSHETYRTMGYVTDHATNHERFDDLYETLDFQKLAIFDFVTLGCDRSDDNYLVRTTMDGNIPNLDLDDTTGPTVIGIDNAITFSLRAYNGDPKVSGPAFLLTASRNKDRILPKETPIAPEVIEHLEHALEEWDTFIASEDIQAIIDQDKAFSTGTSLEVELEWARQRIAALVAQGHVLSRVNCQRLPGAIITQSKHPHPPFKVYTSDTEQHPFFKKY